MPAQQCNLDSLQNETSDIAHRMAVLNPQLGDAILETPGIIVIDEVELHLHPGWQKRILKDLTSVFPNIQFIVATHSPIIISSCKNENLILIKGNQEIKYLPNAYGYSVEDVLELRQESTAKPKGNRGFA